MTTHSSSPERSRTYSQRTIKTDGVDPVVVIWRDAHFNADDEVDLKSPHAFGSTIICWDIGFLVRHDKYEVVLAMGCCVEDNTVRFSTTIPAGMVLDIIPLGTFKWEPSQKNSRSRKGRTRSTTGSTSTSTPISPSTSAPSTTTLPVPQSPSPQP